MAMPAIPGANEPLLVRGKVRTLSAGYFISDSPMRRGMAVSMGPMAVLDTGKVEIVLISRHTEPSDLGLFKVVGIDPAKKRYVVIKSRVHWRADLGSLAKHVVECDGLGVCTSDYGILHFERVRRPIFPLDLINERGVTRGRPITATSRTLRNRSPPPRRTSSCIPRTRRRTA